MVTQVYEICQKFGAPSPEIWWPKNINIPPILRLDHEYLRNATRQRQSENDVTNYGHFRTVTLNLVHFGPQTAKIGLEFWPTQWAAITLGFATHSSLCYVASIDQFIKEYQLKWFEITQLYLSFKISCTTAKVYSSLENLFPCNGSGVCCVCNSVNVWCACYNRFLMWSQLANNRCQHAEIPVALQLVANDQEKKVHGKKSHQIGRLMHTIESVLNWLQFLNSLLMWKCPNLPALVIPRHQAVNGHRHQNAMYMYVCISSEWVSE